ncbi:MAG: DUF3060 domain-containing protein [Myxococcota bacterium]|nr:DUF3060 domain-containing protein [Myxococcota bacterium]
MKSTLLATLLLAVFGLAASGTAHAEVSVLENRKQVQVDCAKDREVNLVGNHITATLTGTCTKVNVTGNHCTVIGSAKAVFVAGNHNTLTLEAADHIAVAGNSNTLTYKRGVAKQPPKVANSGKDNKVTQTP